MERCKVVVVVVGVCGRDRDLACLQRGAMVQKLGLCVRCLGWHDLMNVGLSALELYLSAANSCSNVVIFCCKVAFATLDAWSSLLRVWSFSANAWLEFVKFMMAVWSAAVAAAKCSKTLVTSSVSVAVAFTWNWLPCCVVKY